MTSRGYVLRPRDREEIARLALQHEVWAGPTDAVLARAGFGAGERLADVGCGPGFLSLDLARRVGPDGSIFAVDSSERFVEHLEGEKRARRMPWIRPLVDDIRQLELEPGSLDGAVCRWVLMFVSEPRRAIRALARALRPGGTLAIFEYAQFRSMALWPPSERFARLYAAVHELIARAGGDADIGARIPKLVRDEGFEVVETIAFLRFGHSGSPLWRWLDATNANHGNLVEAGLLSADELTAYHREWSERSTDPIAFFMAPPVLATIARRNEKGT